MQRAGFLVGALAGAVAVVGCSGGPAGPGAPSPPASSTVAAPTGPPPTWNVDPVTPDDAQPAATSTSAESAPATPIAENTTTLEPVDKPVPQGGPWEKLGLTLRSGADVIQQEQLPQSFKDFLISRIGVEDLSGCTVEEVLVLGTHPDGYVFGSEESDCGGMQVVWGIADSQWNYIVAFLDAPPCADIAYNGIPEGAPGLRCTAEDGSARDY